ncbi:MAG: hypothetical protein LBU88_02720 [Treponema sp.]|nr:hypothetical protein [Treponema sp.]
MNSSPEKAPNCLKCVHFKVSWDYMFPNACLLFSIKCNGLPSKEVYRVNNAHCPSFTEKERLKK